MFFWLVVGLEGGRGRGCVQANGAEDDDEHVDGEKVCYAEGEAEDHGQDAQPMCGLAGVFKGETRRRGASARCGRPVHLAPGDVPVVVVLLDEGGWCSPLTIDACAEEATC